MYMLSTEVGVRVLPKKMLLNKHLNVLHFILLYWCLCFNLYHVTICLDAPPVHIPGQGIAVGTYLKMFRTQNIKAYLGIQYAKANRFSPPEISDIRWNGILNATSFAANCWQKIPESTNKYTEKVLQVLKFNQRSPKEEYSENCQFLNIFIPDGSPGRFGYAVLVWIHGGDFSTGEPTDVNPFQLVFKQKVIVVTISYRLNVFGFFTTGDGEAQGNYGLMDQAAALFWVRKNINHFGGNDKEITIMGHSAGAVSVGLHLVSGEWSSNSFTKAILMSGNPLSESSVKLPKYYDEALDMIASTFRCSRRPTSSFVQCLKKIDAKSLNEDMPLIDWGPIVDNGLSNASLPFISEFPVQLFEKGLVNKVPILIGITDMEDVFSFKVDEMDPDAARGILQNYIRNAAIDDFKKYYPTYEDCNNMNVIEDALEYMYPSNSEANFTYKALVDLHTDRIYKAPMHLLSKFFNDQEHVYAYIFNTAIKSDFFKLPDGISVPKYFDQISVWGAPYMESSKLLKTWHYSDKKLSDIIMTLLANFVKTSNPTSSNVYIKWNSYTENSMVLQINDNFSTAKNAENYKIDFWNNYYKKVLKFTADCCNGTYMCKYISLTNNLALILLSFLYNFIFTRF